MTVKAEGGKQASPAARAFSGERELVFDVNDLADQNERDYAAFQSAVKDGRVAATTDI
jgi:hypothetical protein